jgi:hypothetical protein
MDPHYKHTQLGWVSLAAVVPGLLMALVLVPLAHAPAGVAIAIAMIALVGALFAALTVEVDSRQIRVSFTGSIVRRTVELRDVHQHRSVRNPWYYGWGIHRYPGGGWLWNVGGPHAVELVLRDGRRLRIGTDEPETLARAIAAGAPGSTHELAPAHREAPARGGLRSASVAIVLALVLGGGAFLVSLFSRQMRDPVVTVTQGTLTIETPFYGQDYDLADLRGLSLEPTLPCVERRTNGFAGAGLLRGWFDVRGLGRGKLFVDAAQPPFVLLRLKDGFVIVGFSDPAKTRALHEQLLRARPELRR